MNEHEKPVFTDKRGKVGGPPKMVNREAHIKQRIIDGAASEEEKEEYMRDYQQAPPEAPETVDARTAFLVVVGNNGQAIATADLSAVSKLPAGLPQASLEDMYGAVCLVRRDLDANSTMVQVVQQLQMQQQAMQQQAMQRQVNQPVNGFSRGA